MPEAITSDDHAALPHDQDPILDVIGLHAGYEELTILHSVALEVQPGSRTVVFGPNGSGKSTLLKALMGLADISAGTVKLDGRDITSAATEARVSSGLAMVPQIDNIFGNLTVSENLQIGGILDRDGSDERMQEMFELFPVLADRRNAWSGNLSGGERQQVAIGRALMIRPQVLLLDEPSAGLAPRLVSEIFDHVRRVNEQQGVAIVLVEQNVREAFRLAQQAILLEGGQVRVQGLADEVAQAPEVADAYLGGAEP